MNKTLVERIRIKRLFLNGFCQQFNDLLSLLVNPLLVEVLQVELILNPTYLRPREPLVRCTHERVVMYLKSKTLPTCKYKQSYQN